MYLRDNVIERLRQKGYLARKYFWPACHNMEPYASDNTYRSVSLAQTEMVANRVIVLPTGSSIKKIHLDEIVSILNSNF